MATELGSRAPRERTLRASPSGEGLDQGRPFRRVTRISKACDMCRARKVKCDAAQPCRSCRDLGVACTTQYVSRRRGPVSKYAASTGPSPPDVPVQVLDPTAPPTPPPLPPALLLPPAVTASSAVSSTDAIAPLPVLALLVDDYFTYIHPLIPFPHEPTFRQRFARPADRRDPALVALVASMVGALAASFPRSVRAAAAGPSSAGPVPPAAGMVVRCRAVALAARGAHFANRATPMTPDDAAVSYLLGLAAGYAGEEVVGRRLLAEASTFVQELLAEHVRAAPAPPDPLDEQLARRLYWILVLAARSLEQASGGGSDGAVPLLVPPTRHRRGLPPPPPLPAEVDDAYLGTDGVGTQPPGSLSLLAGFNRVVAVYATMDALEAADHVDAAVLHDALDAANAVADQLPPELHLPLPESASLSWSSPPPPPLMPSASSATTNSSSSAASTPSRFYDGLPGYRYYPPADAAPPALADDLRGLLDRQPLRRRQIQLDIQKSNIYTSLFATRSYYLERCAHLAVPGSPAAAAVTAERHRIARSLLLVLAAIPQVNMEPNGCALISKVRQVASTLLAGSTDCAADSTAQLDRFLEILVNLERIGRGGADSRPYDHVTLDDEDRSWADLREEQMRFAREGRYD